MTDGLRITYVGHATTLVELDGVRLLTDPILRNRVLHLQRRPVDIRTDWYTDLDAVLISHLHWDHVDLPSLQRLDPQTRLIVPEGSAALFREQGFQVIEEVQVGQRVHLNGVTIDAVYAEHSGQRVLSGLSADCVGFVVDGSRNVYFAGDTDLFPEMSQLAVTLDVALLPVWGWGPTLGTGHLNPYRAALALRLLAPRMAIPIHWGRLHPIGFHLLRPSFLDEPPHAFARFARQLAPDVDVRIIPPGDDLTFPAP